jgi:hypothetical protein
MLHSLALLCESLTEVTANPDLLITLKVLEVCAVEELLRRNIAKMKAIQENCCFIFAPFYVESFTLFKPG